MDQTMIEEVDPDGLTIELMSDPQPVDPYPLYHALRTVAPNHPSMLGVRFVSSYAGCVELMRSPDFGQSFGFGSEEYGDSAFIKMVGEMLILTNPPQHTRLRRLVSIAFSPRMIERQVPKIQANVDALLDRMAATGGGDLVAEFANPIPAMMLCDLLGAHFEDQPKIQGWSDAVADAVKPVLDEEVLRRADEATLAFHAYIRDLIAERKADPGDDLISALCAVEEEGDRITETELVNVLFTIMAAGSETTTSLIASGTMLIGSHPDERAKLAADPTLVSNAVDEILRYEAPVQNSFMRVALRDTTLCGEEVVEGEHVVALIAAANRDPAQFSDPDRFLIDRPNAGDHLAFGNGIHFCLGRVLGRQQGMIALGTLFRRFPDLSLVDDEIVWRKTLPTRRLDRLNVKI